MPDNRSIIFAHAHDRMQLIIDSYARLTGRPILPVSQANPNGLWQAPFAVIAQATEADPIFFYGNRTAIALFETDAAGLIGIASRRSAKPANRAERASLFERVPGKASLTITRGTMSRAKGREFRIEQATGWTLADEDNVIKGQAARFDSWLWL